ncbi:MAG: histidine phosphatase family protein [Burkholderiaceae bacterium]|nr:histidine phosphatase family protein [Burkholderiaceae bacterium]
MEQKWPQQLWVVRHGQSAGNVARDDAEARQQLRIAVATRDVDTPLSDLGVRQAAALADWFAALPPERQPNVLLFSPYLRARGTAQATLARIVQDNLVAVVADERLREKEFGILDRLTPRGIAQKYPELSEQRQHVGKFYFRPPGGESWCDVILRLRSLLDTVVREYRGERVLIVAHQVIVNCLRYLIERHDEDSILAIDRAADVPNCGVTAYRFDPAAGHNGKLVLELSNFVAPLEQAGAPVTAQPDMPLAPKA